MTMRKSSVSMDLPPSIQSLLDMPTVNIRDDSSGTMSLSSPAPNMPIRPMQAGGQIPAAGLQTGQPVAGPSNPNIVKANVNQTMSQNPEATARIRAGIEAGLASGELNTQDLNMMVQLAETVMQNPSLWPQIRQFAIDKGLATDADLPTQYDEGFLAAILSIAHSMAADVQFGPTQPTMPQGGELQGPSHAQGGIPVKAGGGLVEMEGGEYMIPKHIVKAKGTEFFDKMIKQYEEGGEVKKDSY